MSYSGKLKAHYFNISQIGKFYNQILGDLICISSIRTLQTVKSKIIWDFVVKFMINFTRGNREQFRTHCNWCCFDHCYYLSFKRRHCSKVSWFLKRWTTIETFMKDSISVFRNFADSNKDEIVKYYFTCYFCPLSLSCELIPMFKKAHSMAVN